MKSIDTLCNVIAQLPNALTKALVFSNLKVSFAEKKCLYLYMIQGILSMCEHIYQAEGLKIDPHFTTSIDSEINSKPVCPPVSLMHVHINFCLSYKSQVFRYFDEI